MIFRSNNVYYPQNMIVAAPPTVRRYETFEPILSDEDVEEPPVFIIRHSSNDCRVTQQIESENATTKSVIPIDRTDEEEKESINLTFWFVDKLSGLSHIPYSDVFEEGAEFGETGSNTMDMIFAVMNSIWFLYGDNTPRIYSIYRIQICRQ
eukprot:568067_1